jgi:dTMP kinase
MALIALEGIDGSGKATQAALLAKQLRREGLKVRSISFPQYGRKSSALVKKYLNGGFGDPTEMSPHLASLFFAVDRASAAKTLTNWLKNGCAVIANRYVASNMAHQGCKIKRGLPGFLKFVANLEYGMFCLPKPDRTVLLDITPAAAQQLVAGKGRRSYTSSSHDLHERNLGYLASARKAYLKLARQKGWVRVNCMRNKKVLKPDDIHRMVWAKIKPALVR